MAEETKTEPKVESKPAAAEGEAKADKAKKKLPKGRHRSVIKRHGQSLKRQARNQTAISNLRTAVKKLRSAIEKKDRTLAQSLLKEVTSVLHRASSKGFLHSRNASRRIGHLSSCVSRL